MTWHDGNRMLPPEQWQLALTHVVAAWLKADKTKTGQGVFRKDKLKKAGWVVRCGGGDMNQESSLEDSYADFCPGVVATVNKKEVHFLHTFALCVCWFSKTPDNQ